MNRYLDAGLALLFIICIGMSYFVGYRNGSNKIYLLWEQEQAAIKTKFQEIKEQHNVYLVEHAKKSKELDYEIQKNKQEYKESLDALRDEYDDRLYASEERANLYRRKSEAGAAECRDLGNYATELDRALETGRNLVQRFRLTLGQREREIEKLSILIHSDRNTLNKAALINGQ